MIRSIFLAIVLSFAVSSNSWAVLFDITQLTDDLFWDETPDLNDNGVIVWSRKETATSPFQIMRYDGSGINQITNNTIFNASRPTVSGYVRINNAGMMVWNEFDGHDYEIFLYDGLQTTQLTDNDTDDHWPRINSSGQAVWHNFDGNDYEIFQYDGSTVLQLTNNAIHDLHPDINDSGEIAWHRWDGNDYEIFLNNGAITQITDNTFDDLEPSINANGLVTWYGFEGGSNYYGGTDAEIFYYNGLSVIQLTDNLFGDFHPEINALNQIVWSKGFYDGSIVPQFLNDFGINEPAINNLGDLVWYQHDGTDYEIFLANRVVDSVPIPEPSTLLIFSSGLIGLVLKCKIK